jgi:biopolymer transport protein ExbD
MRDRFHHRQRPNILGFNATPMVDVIFLLTIFFMLVSRFSSAEQVPMDLPKPQDSRARVTRMPERVVVNCRPSDPDDPLRGAVLYSIGPNRPEPLAVVADRLAAMKRKSPELKVVVRADRRLPYADVRAVMRVIAHSGIEMLNVVAHVSEDE